MVVQRGGGTDPVPIAKYSYQVPEQKTDGWQVSHASDLNVNVQKLEQAVQRVQDGQFDIVDSIAVSYRGQLILDETLRTNLNEFDAWVGNTELDMHVLFSASKNIASIAAGIAIEQGLIASVDTPYLSLFDYTNYDSWDLRKTKITFKDALTMSFGLDWNEWDPPYSSNENAMLQFYATETDFTKSFLDLPMVDEPGTAFAYSTPGTVSIGQAIENAAGMPLVDFGGAFLTTPLQIEEVEYLTTPTGLMDVGRGLYLKTRDFLKFGQLYLDKGVWNNQQIVSEQWIEQSTKIHVPITWPNPDAFDWQLQGYGYQWWIGEFEVNGTKYASYSARGHGEQILMVIPELDLVIAVFSHAWQESEGQVNQVLELINTQIIPAVL